MNRRRIMLMNGQGEDEVKEWRLIYDSGETTEELVRTPDINVSGYKELYILGRVAISANNASTRACTAYITDTDGVVKQLVLGTNVLANAGNPHGIGTFIEKIGDLVVSDGKTSANMFNIWVTGYPVDSLGANSSISGVVFLGNMEKLYITNNNCHTAYYFGIGSRFVIYGR